MDKQFIQTLKYPKRKKSFITSIILFVLAAFWFMGAIGFYIILRPVSEDNTFEETAIVSSIQPVTWYKIKTQSFSADLSIEYDESVINMDALAGLSSGQTITFRVRKCDAGNVSQANAVVFIVSLKVNNTDIITLDSYNKQAQKLRFEAIGGFITAGSCFAIAAVFFMLYSKRIIGK